MTAPLQETMSAAQVARLAEFLARGGDLDALLNLAHLANPEMRPLSRLAVKHSADYTDNFLPHTLVFQLNPRAKRFDDQIDVRVISGKTQLMLDVGTVGGAV